MTDADKLERIRSIVADHDAYGLSRHHEMVLDITDVLGLERFNATEQRVLDAMSAWAEADLRDPLDAPPPSQRRHAWRCLIELCRAELARRGVEA